ncbi:glycoside Hydrolase Family 9 protein [Rhizophagus clarus]|nr:glycoside Hydrolase Family 9 protein [Rhizophagus clarus]
MYKLILLLPILVLLIIKKTLAQNYAIPAPDIVDFPQPNSTTQGNYEYTKLLAYSLYFYEAQRSGKLPPDNRVTWRHDSALEDGQDVNLDLTGGYYDAGDHLKFSFPLSWTLTSLSWGAYEWYDGYQSAKQTTRIRDMIKWGTDWLIKAHSDQQVLYVMIGDENVDHNYWGPDTGIPLPRPSLSINSTKLGTDAAAEAAAAMSAAALFFKDKVQDIDYYNTLYFHALQLYDFASIKPFTKYQSSVKQLDDLYPSSDFTDELVWSSLWLYKLTKNTTYFDLAVSYFNDFKLSGSNNVINWDSKIGAVYILFVQCAIELNRNDVNNWKAEAERYLDTVASQSSGSCELTKGGLFYCDGDSDAASLNPALNAAFASLLYSPLSSTPSKKDSYVKFAMSQINYLFGDNPMKTPYVIGVHPNSPQNPHHSGAQGGYDINGPTLNILYGGIVGGPDKNDNYEDKRANYVQSEVALDYNSPFQNLMAYQVINSNEDPYYVTLPPGRPSRTNVALIVSLVVIGIIIIIGIGGFIYWRKTRGNKR